MTRRITLARTLTLATTSLLALGVGACSAVDDGPYTGTWIMDFNPNAEDVDNATCPVDGGGVFDCPVRWGTGDPGTADGTIAAGNVSGRLQLDQGDVEFKAYEIEGQCPALNNCGGDLLSPSTGEVVGTFSMTRL